MTQKSIDKTSFEKALDEAITDAKRRPARNQPTEHTKRRPGRPATLDDGTGIYLITIKVNATQHSRFKAAGGSKWLRDQIDKLPAE